LNKSKLFNEKSKKILRGVFFVESSLPQYFHHNQNDMNKINAFFICLCLYFNAYAQSARYVDNTDIDSLSLDYTRFNRDNKIYKPQLEFVFDYLILDGNDTLKCQSSIEKTGIPDWRLVKNGDTSPATIQKISMYVLNETFAYQTKIGFIYYGLNNKKLPYFEQTGLVENDKNVWLHPARYDYFAMTEFCSFPYITFPLEIGKKWQSNLNIGYFDSYQRFNLQWTGILETEEELEITGKADLKTPFGTLNCWVVSAQSKSKLTESSSTFYFHETYGFVKIDHLLFDKRRLVFNLLEVRNF
jgi:hypothetical protein